MKKLNNVNIVNNESYGITLIYLVRRTRKKSRRQPHSLGEPNLTLDSRWFRRTSWRCLLLSVRSRYTRRDLLKISFIMWKFASQLVRVICEKMSVAKPLLQQIHATLCNVFPSWPPFPLFIESFNLRGLLLFRIFVTSVWAEIVFGDGQSTADG